MRTSEEFHIGFLSEKKSPKEDLTIGEINIGDFEERFESSLTYWTQGQYIRHWRESIKRIVVGELTSCLITDVNDPATTTFITWWPMYRVANQVYIRNQLLFLDSLDSKFNLTNPYKHVPLRIEDNEVSEWKIPIESLKEFLEHE